MKKMIMLICILLCLCMTAAFFTGCGDKQNNDSSTQETESVNPDATQGVSQDAAQGVDGGVTIEEQTIFDDQGIVAVAKSLGKYEDDMIAYDLALVLDVTNNTKKAVSVSAVNLSVNGCVFDDGYGIRIEPGETASVPAPLDDIAMENYGITTISDLEFSVEVDDADSFSTLMESEPISIKTSAYEGFEYKYNESGTVIYDADGVKIIVQDKLTEHDFFGTYANLYVINQTDKNIDVTVVESAVNGEKMNVAVGSYTPAGKRSINILFIEDEDERPEKVESFTLSFSIYDSDTGDVIVEKTESAAVTF